MNTCNNRRRKESQEKIEKTFIELIQTRELTDISVTDICARCNLNRSTFYANYIDIYDLADKLKEKMINDFFDIYKDEVNSQKHSYDFLKLFYHIKDNQIFYKTYFKLNFDYTFDFMNHLNDELIKHFGSTKNMDYHIEFFKAGINAIIKKWLNNGCIESPEEINSILESEYTNRILID